MARAAAWVLVLGVGLGAFSVLGDRIGFLAAPANAVGPWIVVAFAAGALARAPGPGAALGAATLVVAVATYYVGVRLVWGDAFVDPARASAVWGLVATLVGAPVGAAGGGWASGPSRWRVPGVALLAGLLLAEAITRFVEVEGWTGIDFGRTALQVWAYDTIAAVLAPVLLLDTAERRAAYLGSAAIALVAAAALAATLSLIRASATGAGR